MRVTINNYESLISNAEKRALKCKENEIVPRVSDLHAVMASTAGKIEMEATRKAGDEAERKRIQRLEKLAQEEETAWVNVENLLGQKRGSAYEEAAKLLVELRDVADYKQRKNKFAERFNSICGKYGKSAALMERFRRAGLK
ncbi:MAG: hypothetical protein AAB217_03620 [Chloroflexota bacterium]